MEEEMFTLVDRRYDVSGPALKRARRALGLSRAKFAERCGWHGSYQQKLEDAARTAVSESTKLVIEGALRGKTYPPR